MNHPTAPALSGYRVAVTSARRARELCTLLARHGATVTSAAAITMVALADDDELRRNTEALVAQPPDIVIATTGHRIPGLGRRRRRLGAGDRLIAGVVRSPGRGPGTESHRRSARRGSARGVVPGIRVIARGLAVPAGIRHQRLSYRGTATRRERQLGSVSRISRRAPFGRRRDHPDPGVPVEARAARRRVRPTDQTDRAPRIRRGELHLGARCRGDTDARRRPTHLRSAARRAALGCRGDVRRPGHRAATGPPGGPGLVAAANAAGRAGPTHRRGTARAAVADACTRPGTGSRCAVPA